ncbi:MAG: hypothetical protein ACK4GQ_03440 [Candidatus Hadarchaeales archaeon]
MRKIDRLMREILGKYYSQGTRFFNQKSIAKSCSLSLGTVNPTIIKFEQIGAVERRPLGFRLTDPKRLLLYWAATRELSKDIVYTTFSPTKIEKIEEELREMGQLTAYSAYRLTFGSTPVEYSQVFVYASPELIERKFRPTRAKKRNIFVLTPDEHLRAMSKNGIVPIVQAYVDLWQLGAPASRLVEDLEKKLATVTAKTVEEVAKALKQEKE